MNRSILLVWKGPGSRLTWRPSGRSLARPPAQSVALSLSSHHNTISAFTAGPPCRFSSIPTYLLLPALQSQLSVRSASLGVSSVGWLVSFTGTIELQRCVRYIEGGYSLLVTLVHRDRVKDVDILCLGCRWDQEELKRRVVAANRLFYLIPSKKPGATYKVLWYHNYPARRCKVDILLPGIMNIPSFPIADIDYPELGKPCAPFALVFLLKLQAWQQHRDSEEVRFRIKSNTDALDLRRMLPIALAKGFSIKRRDAYLSPLFVAEATSRVKRFVRESPDTLRSWRALGFSVREEGTLRELQWDLF